MSAADYRREIGFGLGTFLGVLVFSLGISLVILFMSVGLTEDVGKYLTGTLRQVFIFGGLALMVLGPLVRLYRSELATGDRVAKTAGTAGFAVGILAFIFGLGQQTSKSAPFLTGTEEKLVLFGVAVTFVVVGLALIRYSARLVGW